MSVKEKISYVWNVILGPDYTDEVDIEKSNKPEDKLLKDSLLGRVAELEQGMKTSTSAKDGKGNSGKVVETVVIDPKAVKAAAKVAAQKQQKESGEKEPEGR